MTLLGTSVPDGRLHPLTSPLLHDTDFFFHMGFIKAGVRYVIRGLRVVLRNIRCFTHCSHSTLPHLCELCGGGVDQAGILCPGRTWPLWHGQHCHGGCQQCERPTLENGQSGNKGVKPKWRRRLEPDRQDATEWTHTSPCQMFPEMARCDFRHLIKAIYGVD